MPPTLALLALVLSTSTLSAASVWTIGGRAATPAGDGCTATLWTGDTILYNSNNAPVTVNQVNWSDRVTLLLRPPTVQKFTIPAHGTIALSKPRADFLIDAPNTPLWIDELDVPEGVLVQGRIEVGASLCNVSPPIFGPVNGKLTAPVFRSLAAANSVQRHIGTDLGLVDARVNVGIFNAGTTNATAHVEVRRACDDAILQQQTISLDPNALRQVSLNVGAPSGSCESYWVTNTIVTVDQPSLSFVSTISNNKTQPIGPVFAPYAISVD